MNDLQRLMALLDQMDVPELRKSQPDVRWLARNLVFRNAGHPKYQEAMGLVVALIKKG